MVSLHDVRAYRDRDAEHSWVKPVIAGMPIIRAETLVLALGVFAGGRHSELDLCYDNRMNLSIHGSPRNIGPETGLGSGTHDTGFFISNFDVLVPTTTPIGTTTETETETDGAEGTEGAATTH